MEKKIFSYLFCGCQGGNISVMNFESFLYEVEILDDSLPEKR
jgi:hypothetical protein